MSCSGSLGYTSAEGGFTFRAGWATFCSSNYGAAEAFLDFFFGFVEDVLLFVLWFSMSEPKDTPLPLNALKDDVLLSSYAGYELPTGA